MPVNAVMYRVKETPGAWLFVAETEFNRNMSQIVEGATDVKTIIFSNTVRKDAERSLCGRTFSYASVQSVVLNEELETIG